LRKIFDFDGASLRIRATVTLEQGVRALQVLVQAKTRSIVVIAQVRPVGLNGGSRSNMQNKVYLYDVEGGLNSDAPVK
jgi:hypothetical protein